MTERRRHRSRAARAAAAALAVPSVLVASVLIAAALGLTAVPGAAMATTSSDGVGAVNALRAQLGVPAITNDETLAGDCQAHATWMRTNASVSHSEPVGSPGYSAAGDDAARNSVLHGSSTFTPQVSAETVHWLHGAPLHLYQVLHPGLVRSGYAYDGTYACMWTMDPDVRTGTDVFDSTRGRGQIHVWPPTGTGAAPLPTSEDTSSELPNPNEQVGLPRARVTGPYLLVFAGGFGNPNACNAIRLSRVRLTDGSGAPVTVRWWDDFRTIQRNAWEFGTCPVPAGGGYVVPERPLLAGGSYALTFDVVGAWAPAGTKATTKRVTLATEGRDTAKPTVRVTSARAFRAPRGRYGWHVVATVRDASPTTCSATVQQVRVRCVVRAGRIVLAGARTGAPRTVQAAFVVRDAAGNERRARVTRTVTG